MLAYQCPSVSLNLRAAKTMSLTPTIGPARNWSSRVAALATEGGEQNSVAVVASMASPIARRTVLTGAATKKCNATARRRKDTRLKCVGGIKFTAGESWMVRTAAG